MTSLRAVGTVGFVLLGLAIATGAAAQSAAEKGKAGTAEAAAAVKASPDLVNALSTEIGATPEQSAGAAGALFSVAKSRLKADEFAQVSKAVPGMGALLKAAPATGGGGGAIDAVTKATGTTGSAAGLASAASAFSSLGLKPDLVAKAIPVLTSFVTKSGGADVGRLLAGALK